MAGGFVSSAKGDGFKEYPGKITLFVLFTCIVGAFGGLIFGYDIGISGGVTSMPSFLKKFFPSVYKKEQGVVATNQYCTYDSPTLTIFTSSLYLAALVASFVASMVTRKYGRRTSMFLGGVIFLKGAALNGAALNITMLIIGRILLGFGVGFANQSVPLYLSEMAPSRHRGALNIVFQMMVTIGILAANLVNYGTNKIQGGWGWRLSLALAAVPAGVITIGSLFLPDTPNSLIERGKSDKAEIMLRKIRGTDDVEDEFNDLFAASEASKSVENPWKNILERRYRPQLVMAIAIPLFQQLTGINVIMFYAPVFFKTIGFGGESSLMSAVITGGVNVVATLLAIFFADKLGRRILFIAGGMLMFVCQIVVGSLIWYKFGVTGSAVQVTKVYANLVVGFICVYVSAFAWSWGPLGWLVPSEIFPLEIRSAGQSINVAVNMFFTFIIAQIFLNMLCHLKFGLFYLFAFFVFVMTVFVIFFLPETKGIPIEEMTRVWRKHWFWKRYVPLEDDDVAGEIQIGNPKNMFAATSTR